MSQKLSNPEHPLILWGDKKKMTSGETARFLANRLDVTVDSVYHWFARRRVPSHPHLLTLIRLTRIPYERLCAPTRLEIFYGENRAKKGVPTQG